MPPITVVHFSADPWVHVCPVVRFLSPAQMAGIHSIRGNEWDAERRLVVHPEWVDRADAVLIQRDFPRYQGHYEDIISRARQAGIPVVYELDDLLTALPPDHPEARHYELARLQILRAAMQADAVTCSTEGIRQYLAPFNPNIRVLPNTIIDDFWPAPPVKTPGGAGEKSPLVIGYMASHSHATDLEMVAPVLEKILDQHPDDILFRCWGVEPPKSLLQRPNVDYVDMNIWSYAEFCAYFSSQHIDIGISPLRQNLFNECKSAIKYLEYSYLGIPAVYSRVGPYRGMVRESQNGFLAGDLEEWEQRLAELIEQPDLRARLSAAARQDVIPTHLLSQQANHWLDFFAQLKPSNRESTPLETVQAFARQAAQWHQDLEERLSQQMELLRQQTDLTDQAWAFHAKTQEQLSQQTGLARQGWELYGRSQETIQQLNRALGLLEQQNQAEILELRATIRQARGELRRQESAASSKFSRGLQSLGRHVFPENSARWRAFTSLKNGLALFRRDGFRAFWRRFREKTRPPELANASEGAAPAWVHIQARVVPSQEYRQPAVSIVAVQAAGMSQPDLDGLKAWAGRQTWQPAELILWDRESQRAEPLDQAGAGWPAADFSALCLGLRGNFILLKGPDLLAQPPTYLETNLAALLSEDLLFTVNLLPGDAAALDWIAGKKAGGSPMDPFTRLVLRKDILGADGSLSLHPNQTAAVGRIISHAAGAPPALALPAPDGAPPIRLVTYNRRIFCVEGENPAPLRIESLLHPIDLLFPMPAERSDRPTVLVASQFFATGGAETILLNLMRPLMGKVRFVVVSLEPQDATHGSTEGDFRQVTPYVYAMPEFIDPLLYASFLDHLVHRFDPLCFYIANGTGWLYDLLPEFHQNHPQVSIANQVYDHQLGWSNHYRPELVADIDTHIASNHPIYQAYQKRRVKPQDIFDIVNGVDPGEYRPDRYAPQELSAIRGRLGIPPGVRVVTFMARLHPQKRPFDFIELARRFEEDPSVFFLMVGNGPLQERVLSQAAKSGLKKFKHMDFYRPSRDIFALSDLLVLPSEYEGMPMVVLEALSSGVPVVATEVGNIREILQVTGGGQAVPQIGDIGALAQAVRRVLADPPDVEAVRKAIIEHYSIAKMAEKYLAVFLRTKHA